MRHRLPSLALGPIALPLSALEPKDALQKWRFSQPVTLSAPVTFTRDTATWTLTSGTAYVDIANKEAKQSVTQEIPMRPKNVVFAPDSSLLASVKRH